MKSGSKATLLEIPIQILHASKKSCKYQSFCRWILLSCAAVLWITQIDGQQVSHKKVSVSEVVFDSGVEIIHWANTDHRTALAKTRKGRLYKSKDGGRQWTEITEFLPPEKSVDEKGEYVVQTVNVNSVDRRRVVIIGRGKRHFVSEDGGETFSALNYTGRIHTWLWHPVESDWALMSSWTDGCTERSATEDCVHYLLVTRDCGKSFDKVASYVIQFSWGDKTVNTANNIYAAQHRNKSGSQTRHFGWSAAVDFSVTEDFGVTWTRLVPQGNKFLVSNGYIFVAQLQDAIKQTVQLYVSTDKGKTFTAAKLPEVVDEKAYTVLDTTEGAIILHVNHGNDNYGNVYISDASGTRFTLSLPNNVRTPTGDCEFDRVASVEGVYISNFRDVGENSEDMSENEVPGISQSNRRNKSDMPVKTVISFDKGGIWSFLKPPKVDSRGEPIVCKGKNKQGGEEACYLHLHGITNFKQYAPFYSVENAVGLVMGTGTVGTQLGYEPDEVNTYLSKDGGLTWVEAHKGAYIYEFGDHGGLTVMADDTKKTNQVVFSWNEGHSWFDFDLSNTPIEVDNIVIEPNASSVEFLLYGTRDGAGVLYHLDFAALSQPPCRGVWAADSVSSDYETWSPSDGRPGGDKCILGRTITYTRRKQTSECFNGWDFQRPKKVEPCTCTPEDYECEMGFTRVVGSTECKPTDPGLTSQGCTTAGYFMTDAYRKVPGDICVGGYVPSKVAVACPAAAPFSIGAKAVLTLVILLMMLLMILTFVSRHPQWNRFLRNYGFDAFSTASYSRLPKESHNGPELGFIDSDEGSDDEAPSLMKIGGNTQESSMTSLFDQAQTASTARYGTPGRWNLGKNENSTTQFRENAGISTRDIELL